MNPKVFGVAVLGLGRMGTRHIAAMRENPLFQLRAVCDANASLAQEKAREYGVSAWASDYREVVARDDVDVVYVCLPAARHAEAAVAAAAHGKHIFCEKPLATTLPDSERMVQAAQVSGVRLAVGFQHRFQKAMAHLRGLLGDGTLGRPALYTAFSVLSVRPFLAMHDCDGNAGPFVDTFCHYVDVWRYLFDSDPVRVHARLWTFAKGKPEVASIRRLAPDTGFVTVEFASGDVGCFQTSWGLPTGNASALREHLVAPEGLVEIEPFSKLTISCRGQAAAPVPGMEMALPELHKAQSLYFAAALRDGTPPRTSGEDGLLALRVSLAAIRSSETGEIVPL